MDRSEIRVGQVVFFTKEGIQHYGKLYVECLSGVPLTVVVVEPMCYRGSMDVYIKFTLPSDNSLHTLWIHSSYVCSDNRCSSDVAFFHDSEAIDMFLSEF